MKPFIIENVIANDDVLEFVALDGRNVKVQLIGDCCSSSYFDDNSKVDAKGLFGERLMTLESTGRDPGEPDPNDEEDYPRTLYYALIIRTDKQSITVDWRNVSNGYYRGWTNIFVDGEPVYGDLDFRQAEAG